MFCTTCGNKLTDGQRFCVKCGSSIKAENTVNHNAFENSIANLQINEYQLTHNKSKMSKKLLAVVTALLILLLGGFLIVNFNNVNSSPQKVVNALMHSIYKEDVNAFLRTVHGHTASIDKKELKNSLKAANLDWKEDLMRNNWINSIRITGVRKLTQKEFLERLGDTAETRALYKNRFQYYSFVTVEYWMGLSEEIPVIKDKKNGKYYIPRSEISGLFPRELDGIDPFERRYLHLFVN